MDNLKKKIIQKSLKQNIYMPQSVRFNFKEFKQLDGIAKMRFLIDQKMLSYNSHKLLEIEDLEQIFIDVNDIIEKELQKDQDQFSFKFYQQLDEFNNFLTNLTEDKHYLFFRSFKSILQVLEKCWNLDVIYISLEILMNFFTIRNKYFQEAMLDLDEQTTYKFFYIVHLWFYGINFCNNEQFKSEEYFSNIKQYNFSSFNVNVYQTGFFQKFDINTIQEKTYFDQNVRSLMDIDLSKYKNRTDLEQILKEISQEFNIFLHEQSLFAQALKMRLTLYNSCVKDDQSLNILNIQNMLYTNVSSYLILFHSSKIQENLEIHNQVRVVINQSHLLDFAYFPIEVFQVAFQKECQDEYQIRSVVSMFNFYNSLDHNPEYYNKLETFLRQILQSMVKVLYMSNDNLQNTKQLEDNEYFVIPSNEFLHQFIIVIWLFYEEEDERHSNTIQYSAVMDSILNIIEFYNLQLEKEYNQQWVHNMAKIICMIKNEVHKDKEIVFLGVLLELFDKHLTLYNRYKDQIKEYPNVLNGYVQLLFEIIEGMFFYILDPAKQKLMHQIPQIARQILEHNFWENENYFDLAKNDEQFYQIFCMSVSLMNDLLYELPENIQPTMIKRFIDNKVIFLINDYFLMQNYPCDYDVVSFYVKLIGNYHLHYPKVIVEDDIKQYIKRIFDLTIQKQMVCNNIKRFLSTYTNETVRNLAEDLIMLTNVHPKFIPCILENLDILNKNIARFENFAMEVQINSSNIQELKQNLRKNNEFVNQYGWFIYKDEPTDQQLYDDFYLLQRHLQNLFKFQTKFFDHSRSNIFKNFFNQENEDDIKYFDNLFDRNIIHFNNVLKFKKNSTIFFKHLACTNNFFTIKRFQKYIVDKVLRKDSFFNKLILYYSLCTDEEKLFISEIFQKKVQPKEEKYQTDLKYVTNNTYNFFNYFRKFVSLIECLKNILQNNQYNNQQDKSLLEKQTSNFVKMIQNFRKLSLDIMIYQKDSLMQNNLQEIENLLLENYTVRIKINQITVIDTILRRISFSELDFFEQIIQDVQDLLNKKKMLQIGNPLKVPRQQYIESFLIMSPFTDCNKNIGLDEKMIYYNKIIYAIIPLFINKNKFQEKPIQLQQSVCELSKRKFFSNFLIDCIKDIFEYIKKNQKVIKKLVMKKELKQQNLDIQDIQNIYKINENLRLLLIYVKTLIYKFLKSYEQIHSNFFYACDKPELVQQIQIIGHEKLDFIIKLTEILKQTNQEHFVCFNYFERSTISQNHRKNTNKQNEQNLYKIDITQIDVFNKFIDAYKLFIKQLLVSVSNLFVQIKKKYQGVTQSSKEDELIHAAELMGFQRKQLIKAIKNFDLNKSKEQFITLLLEQQQNNPAESIDELKTPIEADQQDQQLKESQQNMKTLLHQNLANFVNHTFVNFLQYKELYDLLSNFWLRYQKDNKKQKSFNKILLNQIQYSIKCLTGTPKKQKQNKTKWQINLNKPRDALYYFLKLQNEIQNQIKKQNSKTKDKNEKDDESLKAFQSVNFLLKLLQNLAQKKNKIRRIQDSMNTILEIISEMELTQTEKIETLKTLQQIFEIHKSQINQKYKVYLIDEKFFCQILKLINIMIYQDEEFTNELIQFSNKDFLKNILRIELIKNSDIINPDIMNQFRHFIEQIVRRKSTLKILFQSEITNLLQENSKIELLSFCKNFEKYIKGSEYLFTQVVKKICIVERQNDTKYITLNPEFKTPVKNNECKTFIKEFMITLIKDLIVKNTKKYQNQKSNYYFNDLVLSDIIFLQLLPRYPFLYLIKSLKEKTYFTIFLFEKFIKLHWGYISFFEPLIYDSHFLIKNQQDQIVPINQLILGQILDLILNMINDMNEKLQNNQKLDILQFTNISIFMLNIIKASHIFKRFGSQILQILLLIENICLIQLQQKKLQIRFENLTLAVSVIMRRIQILYLINHRKIKEIEDQKLVESILFCPRTFAHKISEWPDRVEKNSTRDHSITYSYKSHITYEKFLTSQLSQDNNMSKILNRLKRYQYTERNEEPPIIFRGIRNRNDGDVRRENAIQGGRHQFINRMNTQELNFLMRQEGGLQDIHDLEELNILQQGNRRPEWRMIEELEYIEPDDNVNWEQEDEEEEDDEELQEMESDEMQEESIILNQYGEVPDLGEVVEIYEEHDDENEDEQEFEEDEEYQQSLNDQDSIEIHEESVNSEEEQDSYEDNSSEDIHQNMYIESSQDDLYDMENYSQSQDDQQMIIEEKKDSKSSKNYLAQELYQTYPFIFPLNLANKSFNFYEDQMNQHYQFFLTKYLLSNCNYDLQKTYQNCDQDFINFNFKDWDPKKMVKINNRQQNYHNRRAQLNRGILDFELIRIPNIDRNFSRRILLHRDEIPHDFEDVQRINRDSIRLLDNNMDYMRELETQMDNNNNFSLISILQDQLPTRNVTQTEQQNNQNQQIQNNESQQQQQNPLTVEDQMAQHIIQFLRDNEAQNNNQNRPQQNAQIPTLQDVTISEQENHLMNLFGALNRQNFQLQQNLQNQLRLQNQQQQNQQQNQQQQNQQQQNQQQNQQQQNIQQNQQQNQQQQNQQQEQQNQNNEQQVLEQNEQQVEVNVENQEQEQMNIEQSENEQAQEFDFGAIGLPDNFLEIAQIDPTFFYALPPDLQAEIAIEQGDALNLRRQPVHNRQQSNQNQDQQQLDNGEQQSEMDNIMEQQNANLVFLESLAPDMREEVLLTCPDEFLQSLPLEQQQEAAQLRENNIIEQRYVQRNLQPQQTQNILENKVKKNLKNYKVTELLKKMYPVKIYSPNEKLLQVLLDQLKDPQYNLRYIPLSLLSCLLFDEKNLQSYFDAFLEVMESQENRKVKIKFLVTTIQLTSTNFHVFLEQTNYLHLIEFLPKHDNDFEIIGYLLRIIANITKKSVIIKDNQESCSLNITERGLENLTQINSANNMDHSISDYLSLILMILSFKKENLRTIVTSLKDNISRFALNLNSHLKIILETKKDTQQEYMEFIEKIIMQNLSMYNRFSKLFKLVESLFSRSFKSNLRQQEKNKDKKDFDIEENKLNKVKEQVLKEFSNYFEDQSIKRVFTKVFKIINLFEKNYDDITGKKNFSKPTFYKMLALIDSFFILYKIQCDDEDFQSIKKKYNLHQKTDAKIADYTDQIKSEEDPSEKEFQIREEVDLQQMFDQICKKNQKVLNFLMKKIPKLTDSPLRIIIKKCPKLVDFQLKRKYFAQKIQSLRIRQTYLSLKIRREMLFTDSFTQLVNKQPLELRQKLHIRFQNEEGEDAGGLTREWFQLLSKEIFNPNYALFIPAAHGYAYQPSPYSSINQEHLKYFKFIGRIVGKTLFEGQLLDAHFTRSFYKHMVGTSLNYFDFEDYDPEYFKTLKWMLENDVNALDLTFSYETNHFGIIQSKPLKPDGDKITVTNENKKEYIKLLCYAKMANEIKPQIEQFLSGLHDVVPKEMVEMFTAEELELMISGMPQIDLLDLKKNTIYVNYTKDDIVIQNFWKVMNDFDESQRAGFLQYVTGTSKIPLEGFAELKGMNGNIQKFQIHKAYDTNKLPTSHTCMNQLDLPSYSTYEELKQKLTIAITYGKEGFGFL